MAKAERKFIGSLNWIEMVLLQAQLDPGAQRMLMIPLSLIGFFHVNSYFQTALVCASEQDGYNSSNNHKRKG